MNREKIEEQIRGALEGTRELDRGAPFRLGVLFGFVAVAFVSLFTSDGWFLSGVFFGVVLAVMVMGVKEEVVRLDGYQPERGERPSERRESPKGGAATGERADG